MKRTTKIILILSSAMIFLGIVFGLIGLSAGAAKTLSWGENGFEVYRPNENRIEENVNLAPFSAVQIDSSFMNVEVVESDRYGIELSYRERNGKVEYRVENGVLVVNQENWSQSRGFHFNLGFNFDFRSDENRMTVYVPKTVQLSELLVDNGMGEVTVDGINADAVRLSVDFAALTVQNLTSKNVELELSNGAAKIDGVQAETLTFSNDFGASDIFNVKTNVFTCNQSMGALRIRNITTQECEVTNSFGAIEVENMVSQKKFVLKNDNGATEVDGLQTDLASFEASFGKIDAENLNVKGLSAKNDNGETDLSGLLLGEIVVESSFGQVEISTSRPRADYQLNVSADFGQVKMDGENTGSTVVQNAATGNSITVTNDNGSIDIDFQD